MSDSGRTVAVLGASPKRDRYANLALHRLKDAGHRVLSVNPTYDVIEGDPALPSVRDASEAAPEGLNTITVYVSPEHLETVADDLVAARPARVIFNPGSENPRVQNRLDAAGIPWIEACTLVLLSTGQF